jgi:hypothetical protein
MCAVLIGKFPGYKRPIVSLNKFCQEAGISPITTWRWRRKRWLFTVNIWGRQYVTGEAVGRLPAPG